MLALFTNLDLIEFQVRYFQVLFLLFSVIDGFKWSWIWSLHKNTQLMLEFLKSLFLVLHLYYSILMTFLVMLSAILLSMLMIPLSTLNVICIWSVATTRIGFWTSVWSSRHCELGQEVACWKTQKLVSLVTIPRY